MQNKGSLHNKFEGFGAQPSEKLWDSIASNLDQRKKKRAIIFWWLGSGLAAGIIVLFGVKFMNDSNNINTFEQIVNKTNQVEKIESFNENVPDLGENIQISNPTKNNLNNPTETFINKQIGNLQEQNRIDMDVNSSSKKEETNDKTQLTIYNISDNHKVELVVEKREYTNIDKLNVPVIEQLAIDRNVKLGFNDIVMPKSKPKLAYSFKIQSQKGFELNKQVDTNLGETTSTNNVEFDLMSNGAYSKKTFRPMTLRFGVAAQLKKRLSFQTGVDLGWIQTNDITTKVSLFTIGIPLKLNLTLIERKRGAFYSDFGLVNEIPLFEITSNFTNTNYKSISSKFASGFLGGTELGLGFNYKINEKLKFDINSGFKWYYYQGIKNVTPIIKQNAFITFNAGLIWKY